MKILLYTPNQEKYKAIAALSAGLGVELQALSPADFATPLYKLLGLPPLRRPLFLRLAPVFPAWYDGCRKKPAGAGRLKRGLIQ